MAYGAVHVFRWDLDKTYLRTEFDSLRGLLRAALETARDKEAYPGAPALLRALGQSEGHRICIVSGSPKQMRRVLAAKLALDGILHHEFVLKNNLRNLMRGRFRALRSQVPYKLPVLLEGRLRIRDAPPETLFGDDAEADAVIYSLYADLLAGAVSVEELRRVLEAARAYADEMEHTLDLARRVPRHDVVKRILIHLDQKSPTAGFARFGRRLVPIFNYFQAALILYGDGVLSARQVLFVGKEMLESPEYDLPTLANSLQDLLRRGRLSPEVAERFSLETNEAAASGAQRGLGDMPRLDEIAWAFAERVKQLGGAAPLEWPDENPVLDYVSLVDQEHQSRRGRHKARRERA